MNLKNLLINDLLRQKKIREESSAIISKKK